MTKETIQTLAKLCAESGADYVTVCQHDSGRAGVSLSYETDEDAARVADTFGITLSTRTLDAKYWLGGSVRIDDAIELSIYGPHRVVETTAALAQAEEAVRK